VSGHNVAFGRFWLRTLALPIPRAVSDEELHRTYARKPRPDKRKSNESGEAEPSYVDKVR